MRLCFLGIGLMGLPMSRRLVEAELELSVWNRTLEKCLPLAHYDSVTIADSPADAVKDSDVVFLCLTNSQAVAEVWRSIKMSMKPGSIIVDCSSIDPLVTRELYQEASTLNVSWVDCPVSGGVSGAESGSLAMMAGGDPETVESLRPLLIHLGSKLTYMGPTGSGQYSKICNQMIVSCNALVIAEVVAFAERAGVDSSKLAEAFSGGFADSRPLQILGPEMAERRFTPVKWHVDTLKKDLAMAVEHSGEISQTPMTHLAYELMSSHSDHGFGGQDPATLIKKYL